MDDTGSRSSFLPISTLVVLAAAVGGWIFVPAGMKSFRPEMPEDALVASFASEDVPARLWQDPFAAVLEYRDELRAYRDSRGTAEKDVDDFFERHHEVEALVDSIGQHYFETRNRVVIMPVMVLGGQLAESIEERRRQRYAVVAGLGRRGLVPERDQTIGFLETWWRLSEGDHGPRINFDSDSNQAESLLIDVPFEWYGPAAQHERARSSGDHSDVGGVLILWIDETRFGVRPYSMLKQLLERLIGRQERAEASESVTGQTAEIPTPRIELSVIGPATSTTLRALLQDIKKPSIQTGERLKLRFFSSRATRWPDLFSPEEQATYEEVWVGGANGASANARVDAGNLPALVVTVSNDRAVLGAIIAELELRGKTLARNAGSQLDHVAMVGEWDTHYGRALTRTLRTALCQQTIADHGRCLEMATDELSGLIDNVHEFYYLRGIDGLVPGEQESENQRSANAGQDSQRLDLRTMEQPQGRSQLDYIRRLADRMANLDRDLRAQGERGIKVVGVAGSDLYDQQLILQALRSRLPNALYFTTDLDARLYHPSQYHWSRNMLVASSFGLQLRDELQGSFPPFRNTYQTSTFLATQLALGPLVVAREENGRKNPRPDRIGEDKLDWFLGAPRVFEIARSGAYDLSWSIDDADSLLHPDMSASRRRILPDRWPVLLLVAAFLALVPFSPAARRMLFFAFRDNQAQGDSLTRRQEFFLNRWTLLGVQIGFVLVLAGLIACIHIDAKQPTGEPFELLQGISVWPTEILRLFAVMMSVYFMTNSALDILVSNQDIEARYGLPDARGSKGSMLQKFIGSARTPVQKLPGLLNWLAWRVKQLIRDDWKSRRMFRVSSKSGPCDSTEGAEATGEEGANVTVDAMESAPEPAEALWGPYRRYGSPWRRGIRVAGWLIAYVVFFWIVFSVMGAPESPARSDLARWLDGALIFASSLGLVVLALFVLDANKLTAKLIRCFEEKSTEWPHEAMMMAKRIRGIEHEEASEWLEISLIAERTAVIGRFVVYPFLVLTVLLVARNGFFDLWTWPLSLLLVFGVLSLFIVVSGLLLRRAAEAARRTSVKNLRGLLCRLEGSTAKEDRQRIKQVQMTIEDIKAIGTGAFSSWGDNPVVRAVLLPFGGTGLVILFDMLSRFGF